jgi:hypothetical protein
VGQGFGGERAAMKKVLMVAYHFPPLAGSSGIQRTLRFAQQLPEFGWEPIVLTAHPRAYERTSDDLLDEVPARLTVKRAFALDTARQLAIGGRYLGWLARPDRWMTWRFAAVGAGLSLVREHAPHAIWSTYPIATAHVIGRALARKTQLPWIADFRDPMAQDGYPADPATWKSFKDIEREAIADARLATFTTPGAAREYRRRYPASGGSHPRARERIRRRELRGASSRVGNGAAYAGCGHAAAQRHRVSLRARSDAVLRGGEGNGRCGRYSRR